MTYFVNGDDDIVEPELKMRIEEDKHGDYVKLTPSGELEEASKGRIRCGFLCKWMKFALLFSFLGGLAFVFFRWVGPFVMDKEIIPLINWERTTFSIPVLAVLLFVTVALFPIFLLPSSPSMWVAGMTFGYGFGFLLIMPAVAIGVSLPYFIGSLFYHKIQGCLERYPKRASIIRLAGEGDWINQFQAVFLIRVSPFPYIVYNYCAVATNVKYGPYFLGSLVGMIPDVLVAIYTGILIRTLADASHKHQFLSPQQIIFNVLGFAATVATTVVCTIFAKRRLSKLQLEDDMLLQ